MKLLRRATAFLPVLLAMAVAVRAQQAPAGATARCRDGSYSFSQNRRGTCSHHGGVAAWLTQGGQTAPKPATQGVVQETTLTTTQAKEHVGQSATVCGQVASTRYAAQSRGQPTFLNLDQPYPNQVFTVVIWGESRGNFPAAPETLYQNKRICVSGTLQLYQGVAEIVASTPAAMRITQR